VKSRILRGRRALKDLLDPLLGEQHATRVREAGAHIENVQRVSGFAFAHSEAKEEMP
jgi:hypothetical protein